MRISRSVIPSILILLAPLGCGPSNDGPAPSGSRTPEGGACVSSANCVAGTSCVDMICTAPNAAANNATTNATTGPNATTGNATAGPNATAGNTTANNQSANTATSSNTAPNAGVTCAGQGDCLAGTFCEMGVCQPGCLTELNCEQDQRCGDDGQCEAASCDLSPDPQAWCDEELGVEEAVCMEGMCQEGANLRPLVAAQVLDLTSGSACNVGDAPGTDVIAVELLDASDQTIAWGSVLAFNEGVAGPQGNAYTSTVHLDGLPPGIDAFNCPLPDDQGDAFRADTVTALGCGGDVIVEFLDTNRDVARPVAGMKVAVLEYGAMCEMMGGAGMGAEDSYELYLCEQPAAGEPVSNADCLVLASDAPAQGYAVFEVPAR